MIISTRIPIVFQLCILLDKTHSNNMMAREKALADPATHRCRFAARVLGGAPHPLTQTDISTLDTQQRTDWSIEQHERQAELATQNKRHLDTAPQ